MERINFARLGYDQDAISRLVLLDLEREKQRLAAKITETQEILGGKLRAKTLSSNGTGKKKHNMSAEGRAAVAAAQKRRWAKVKREKKALAAKPRRTKAAKPKLKPKAVAKAAE